jgi:beta-lactam-binding protein with PASTA domain
VPDVSVPDIRKKNTEDAEKVLKEAGLRLGDQSESCDRISASPVNGKLKQDQIRCQSPAPGSMTAPNTSVLYVIGEDEKDD